VFVNVSDPITQGIVENLARPTGNSTGFTNLEFSLVGKWLQILREIAPAVKRVALMIHVINARAFETSRDRPAIGISEAEQQQRAHVCDGSIACAIGD
jgi:putative ABC transport system substrate-binding protein